MASKSAVQLLELLFSQPHGSMRQAIALTVFSIVSGDLRDAILEHAGVWRRDLVGIGGQEIARYFDKATIASNRSV